MFCAPLLFKGHTIKVGHNILRTYMDSFFQYFIPKQITLCLKNNN